MLKINVESGMSFSFLLSLRVPTIPIITPNGAKNGVYFRIRVSAPRKFSNIIINAQPASIVSRTKITKDNFPHIVCGMKPLLPLYILIK